MIKVESDIKIHLAKKFEANVSRYYRIIRNYDTYFLPYSMFRIIKQIKTTMSLGNTVHIKVTYRAKILPELKEQ